MTFTLNPGTSSTNTGPFTMAPSNSNSIIASMIVNALDNT